MVALSYEGPTWVEPPRESSTPHSKIVPLLEFLFLFSFHRSALSCTRPLPHDEAMSRPLRILFLHGFESGPHGIKVKRLRALPNVQVVAPQMEVAKYRSPLHNPHLMALGVFALATLSLVGISAYLWNAQGRPPVLARVSWFSAGVSVAAVAGAAVAARAIWRSAVRYVIDSSLKVQIDAVRAHRPDILVGSSFGGGLIAHLVNKQIWHGPAVLLAPAHTRTQRHLDNSDFVFDEHAFQFVDSRRRRSADVVAAEAAAPPSDLSLPLNLGLLLIHPTHDAQVPFADSIRLLRDTVERDPLFPIKLVEGAREWRKSNARSPRSSPQPPRPLLLSFVLSFRRRARRQPRPEQGRHHGAVRSLDPRGPPTRRGAPVRVELHGRGRRGCRSPDGRRSRCRRSRQELGPHHEDNHHVAPANRPSLRTRGHREAAF